MKLLQLRTLIGVIVSMLLPILVQAAVPSWQIIPSESSITFTATQNNAPVSGSFTSFTGDIKFDPTQLAESHVRIVVDMNSVHSSYNEMSDTLKMADWFNIKLFPQAVFTADKFTKTGDNTYQANGMLKLRDKTLPTVLNFSVVDYSATAFHATGNTMIKRTAFGVGQGDWAKTDAVKDEVKVNFMLSAKSL